jgi:hypothetical protein
MNILYLILCSILLFSLSILCSPFDEFSKFIKSFEVPESPREFEPSDLLRREFRSSAEKAKNFLDNEFTKLEKRSDKEVAENLVRLLLEYEKQYLQYSCSSSFVEHEFSFIVQSTLCMHFVRNNLSDWQSNLGLACDWIAAEKAYFPFLLKEGEFESLLGLLDLAGVDGINQKEMIERVQHFVSGIKEIESIGLKDIEKKNAEVATEIAIRVNAIKEWYSKKFYKGSRDEFTRYFTSLIDIIKKEGKTLLNDGFEEQFSEFFFYFLFYSHLLRLTEEDLIKLLFKDKKELKDASGSKPLGSARILTSFLEKELDKIKRLLKNNFQLEKVLKNHDKLVEECEKCILKEFGLVGKAFEDEGSENEDSEEKASSLASGTGKVNNVDTSGKSKVVNIGPISEGSNTGGPGASGGMGRILKIGLPIIAIIAIAVIIVLVFYNRSKKVNQEPL